MMQKTDEIRPAEGTGDAQRGGDQDSTRTRVSEAYTRAVGAGTSCCGGTEMKGVAAKLAGYTAEEMAALPGDAVENAFGCGNPLAFADVREGEVILDLGSGAGIDLLLAARRVGPTGRVIGVDMTDAMIERARANAAAAGFDTIEVRKGIIEELPVADGSVDAVISNCVINLSPEKHRVFAEIARVLKPGGRVRVSDIVVEELPEWVRESPELYASCIGGAISEADYVAGLSEAGLTDVEVPERLVYDGSQLESLVSSEIVDAADGCGCGGVAGVLPDGISLERALDELQGKVWSAIFLARKPE